MDSLAALAHGSVYLDGALLPITLMKSSGTLALSASWGRDMFCVAVGSVTGSGLYCVAIVGGDYSKWRL